MSSVIGITCTTLSDSNGINIEYIKALENARAIPILLPFIENKRLLEYLDLIDGLLLSGGVDVDPYLFGEEPIPAMGSIDVEKDRVEMFLAKKALEIDIPVFGICRGIQLLNVAAGGTLHQDIKYQKGKLKHRQEAPRDYGTHSIEIKENTKLMEIMGKSIRVNTFHHQAVKQVAPGFIVSAVSSDGIIEGVESITHSFAIGVQFHPERMWRNSTPIADLFKAFVKAADKYREMRDK
ncbi:gamma-glutamyl-gamma-aminobutyrate hydrolase family protein [Candidatus Poribacteria bacterium]|nr:gamma-glutamyl-gamma-aminobutyrate hydrolase family protein [Candidatus Poribacteria bacterium]